ncbi:MAG TPA: hypothetical protein VGR85_03105 [Candidatus Limnocylindria bacterium]|jgi:hypothetical protein|nr:hypothetical protein [Candidatus Limnocylindria bacterium]
MNARYRTTARTMRSLRADLERLGVASDLIERAVRVEPLTITLSCDDHGDLTPLEPVCGHPDHGPEHKRLERVVVDHAALDEIERTTSDDTVRGVIAGSRERLS